MRPEKMTVIFQKLQIYPITGQLQWLPEQMECGNAQIGKSAVALWIPMTQKWFMAHLKALNVGFNMKHQTLQKL